MNTLDDALRAAGPRLNGLTLWPSTSPAGRWQGNVRWQGSDGWTVAHSNDPVEAMVKALRETERFDHTRHPATPPPEPTTAAPVTVPTPTTARPTATPALSGGLFD